VIRDILHRLAERFPTRVLVWPVAVQGKGCAEQVAGAIRGFNALAPGAELPRPDVLIVARGGGSVEDLWGFNEEIVARAAAASEIPLISAVGHETDTTLIDLAADRRAPTPSAAAEMAVPVRAELRAALADLEARRVRAEARRLELARQRLGDISRALPRPAELIETRQQRLDWLAARLPAPERLIAHRRQRLADLAARLPRPDSLIAHRRERFAAAARRLPFGLQHAAGQHRRRLDRAATGLRPRLVTERIARGHDRLAERGGQLAPLLARQVAARRDRLDALARLLGSLGYRQTLARGFAVVRDADGGVVTDGETLSPGAAIAIEFRDRGPDRAVPAVVAGSAEPPARRTARKPAPAAQGSLFDED
jgi:exodeoxyribonuclease VII large subunit